MNNNRGFYAAKFFYLDNCAFKLEFLREHFQNDLDRFHMKLKNHEKAEKVVDRGILSSFVGS